ncbi:hypothetical protein B0H13DRAFT_2534069 [Mycena leptocephala]|nr:hypothetical protein B0H13DRAFT_2534069 [Mycena leptocephala]
MTTVVCVYFSAPWYGNPLTAPVTPIKMPLNFNFRNVTEEASRASWFVGQLELTANGEHAKRSNNLAIPMLDPPCQRREHAKRSNCPAIPMLDPPCPQRPSRKNTATLDREFLDCVLFSADPYIVHSLESSKLRKRRNRGKNTISNPLNPVHLTHIQFNSATGELSGLPLYYCQLLSESGCVPRSPVSLKCSDNNADWTSEVKTHTDWSQLPQYPPMQPRSTREFGWKSAAVPQSQ